MTKEEIIRQYEPHPNKAEVGVIGKMMDEYAKQQAIAYDIWKRVNGYTLNYPNYEYVKLVVTGDKAVTSLVPIDEVYAQFIEQQNKP